jgi:hypothetical protein
MTQNIEEIRKNDCKIVLCITPEKSRNFKFLFKVGKQFFIIHQMARGGRSGGGFRSGGSSRSSSNTSSRNTSVSPPRQAQPTPAPVSGGMGSGLMGTLVQGMAFGAGSEVAHQAVRGMMGGNSNHAQAAPQEGQQQATNTKEAPCTFENSNFVECLKFSNNDIARCQEQFNAIQNCQKNQ